MGILFMVIGGFILLGTYFKPGFYWNARKAMRLRNIIGDQATAILYYAIGAVLLVLGILGQLNIINLS